MFRSFDISVTENFFRQDPNVKLLVLKNSKKNIHRAMKLRKSSMNTRNPEVEPPIEDHQDDQWLKDNLNTMEVYLRNKFSTVP